MASIISKPLKIHRGIGLRYEKLKRLNQYSQMDIVQEVNPITIELQQTEPDTISPVVEKPYSYEEPSENIQNQPRINIIPEEPAPIVKESGEDTKLKVRKRKKIELFETVIDEEAVKINELQNEVNKDGYYDEIRPEDDGEEVDIKKYKVKKPTWYYLLIIGLSLFAVIEIVISVLRII